MPVRQTIPYHSGTFFITFTCYNWLSLIDAADGYDVLYHWFNHLIAQGHYVNGYVLMPNHVHALISFRRTEQSINTIIANGKRFAAYELVKRLEALHHPFLAQLRDVSAPRSARGKLHNVWELSFDWKDCRSDAFMLQKLEYMHANPVRGVWNLCTDAEAYLHSSALFYGTGAQPQWGTITHYLQMQDINLEK